MTRILVLASLAGCCFLLTGCETQEPRSGLVISNVTVISPERDTPMEHAYVRIVDKKIAEVNVRRLRGDTEIDGSGRYLIPGLIDTHVHLAVSPGYPAAMTATQAAAHPKIVAAALEQDPKSYLFFGFTTVLDLVGTAERTAQWNIRDLRPDAYFCTAAIIINHEIRFAIAPYFSYDMAWDERIPPVVDPAKHTPEAVVSKIADDGALCLKTIHEVGLTPTVEEVRALVAAAHARDMPVFIHANRKSSQAFAIAAGVDVIAHGMWRSPGEEAALDDEALDILATIARDNIGYQPTTQVIVGQFDMLDKSYFSKPQLADAYPATLIELYAGDEGAAGTPEWVKNANTDSKIHMRETIDRATEVTRILGAADAHLLFGTDTPSDLIYTNPPGLNGRLEMNNWIKAGISLKKLFQALTINNARIIHLQDDIGTVQSGKTANLLLLTANPLRSVEAYDTIETVFLHGKPIARGDLSARHASSGNTESVDMSSMEDDGANTK